MSLVMCEPQDMNVVFTFEVVVAGYKKPQLCKISW
jgi:hypothetical protein